MSAETCAQCAALCKTLLLNITQLLSNGVTCFGINYDKMVVNTKTETVVACAPMLTQNECLENIMKDLAHYAAAFQSYLNFPLKNREEEVPLLKSTLGIIQSLRKDCSLMPNEEQDSSSEEDDMWGNDTFDNRQKMCKMLKGFHIRTITINRAMGYISSGEHRQ
ncbi:hypothetical protein LDENG_00282320 [Lucifuga dentata]|nr:hypothetical protein LDENG_00282320 [Lucifuga dentata]